MSIFLVLISCSGFLLGLVLFGFYFHRKHLSKVLSQARKESETLVAQAKQEADKLIMSSLDQAKEEANRHRQKFAKEAKKRHQDYHRLEQKNKQRESALEKKADDLKAFEDQLTDQKNNLTQQQKYLVSRKKQLDQLIDNNQHRLEQVASMSMEQAKQQLIESLKEQVTEHCEQELAEIEQHTRDNAKDKAKHIIALAIQRQASEFVNHSTVTVMSIPGEDMKGRIIGREGRNIRAIEQATGVDIIIDDTPEAIILSCFNDVRREIAKIALERLIEDGRIHPARIKETVDKVTSEFNHSVKEYGEQAALDVGVSDLHPTLLTYLGHLKFRSLGKQSVLDHSIETAQMAQILASELDISTKAACRAGLLHDVGQAVNQELEGNHAQIGADLCAKYGEREEIIDAIRKHHDEDLEFASALAICVSAANQASSMRLGARSKDIQSYIKRLSKMEELVANMHGVQKAMVIQTGREIRVIVDPEHVLDEKMSRFTKQIANRLREELTFPARVKVSALRTTRFVDYAK